MPKYLKHILAFVFLSLTMAWYIYSVKRITERETAAELIAVSQQIVTNWIVLANGLELNPLDVSEAQLKKLCRVDCRALDLIVQNSRIVNPKLKTLFDKVGLPDPSFSMFVGENREYVVNGYKVIELYVGSDLKRAGVMFSGIDKPMIEALNKKVDGKSLEEESGTTGNLIYTYDKAGRTLTGIFFNI